MRLGLSVGAVVCFGCNALIGLDAPEHEDLCVGVVCSAVDTCHEAGQCDPATGVCTDPPAADGIACDDGDLCTQTDACQGGVCVGASPVVCPQAGACQPGECRPETGLCAAADGTACDDGDHCDATETCQAGVCASQSPDPTWAHWVIPDPDTPKPYVITDHVVVDTTTGRTWQRILSPDAYTWQEAKDYCAGLTVPGYPSGWRLPTRIELVSIVDYTRQNPAIDTVAFPDTPSAYFWSSSPFAGGSSSAWGVYFYAGGVSGGGVGNAGRVRCVR